VNIKIDDRDSVEIMLEKGILGPNGNIIQDTETLRLDIACAATSAAMMAWRRAVEYMESEQKDNAKRTERRRESWMRPGGRTAQMAFW